MAANQSEQSAAVGRAGAPDNNEWGRDRLARIVVFGSFLTLFLLVAVLLGIAQGGNKGATDLAEKTFNTILPVLATWVGTVLAFYFSSQSLDRTSRSLDKFIQQAAGTTTTGPTAAEKMIPLAAIRKLQDITGRPLDDIKIANLQAEFAAPAEGGAITRLMFVDKGVFRYVLHVGTLNAFLVKNTKPLADTTLRDFLTDPDVLRQVSKLVVFVPATATLADAKAALDGVPGAQDIIVTATGNASGTMLGWITNVDLTKALTAG